MSTGDGERFIRFWYEIKYDKFDCQSRNADDAKSKNYPWVAVDKGGTYRKWYGNQNYAVWWKDDGKDIKACKNLL